MYQYFIKINFKNYRGYACMENLLPTILEQAKCADQ